MGRMMIGMPEAMGPSAIPTQAAHTSQLLARWVTINALLGMVLIHLVLWGIWAAFRPYYFRYLYVGPGPGLPGPPPDRAALIAAWSMALVLFGAAGLLAGAAQAILLRRWLPRWQGWLLVTALGWLVAAPLTILANQGSWFRIPMVGALMGALSVLGIEALRSPGTLALGLLAGWETWALLGGLCAGLAAGVGQWFWLRQRHGGAVWWIPVSSGASAVAWLAGLVLLMLFWQFPGNTMFLLYLDGIFVAGGMYRGSLPVGWTMLSGAVSGLTYGLITGLVLLRLLREQPTTQMEGGSP